MPFDLDHHRPSTLPIVPLFRERWSARALSGEAIGREELQTLLEAARWAPAHGGDPAWRVVYALRDSESWPGLLEWAPEADRPWARHGGALVVWFVPSTGDEGPFPDTFAAGAAWQNLALQATAMGLFAHPLAPANPAPRLPEVPRTYRPLVVTVIGRPGQAGALPEAWQAEEVPSPRPPLETLAGEGRFPTRAQRSPVTQ